ncbi:unnamed protein product [Ophioblennius macclurei]
MAERSSLTGGSRCKPKRSTTTTRKKVTDDEEPKVCGVCGDLARGYHFNALTCEGCKSFFRRVIKRSTQLQCPLLNNCTITKNSRRSCQACRFQKCQSIGMRGDMVMSEEQILERRIRIQEKKMRTAASQLSTRQEEMIQELLCGHRSTFDPTFSHFKGFRSIDRNMHEVFKSIIEPFDLTTYMIQDIIKFSKSFQAFRSLSMGDQISLLKGATFEIMQIRFNMVFNSNANNWKCGTLTYCIGDALRAGFQGLLLEPLLKLHHTLRKLDLHEEEYVLIQAMSLFSPDRPGVLQHRVVDRIQENLALTLKTWIDCKRTDPEKHLRYPKVIACFTEMRTMTEEYSKQILKLQDMQPDTISPLIMEVVSKDD